MARYLLDTHTLLWHLEESAELPIMVRELLLQPTNQVFISVASWWEMAIKLSIGKLNTRAPLAQLMQLADQGYFKSLAIEPSHLLQLAQLPFPANGHRDPFDRLLIAQAQAENLTLLSRDAKFDAYSVQRLS
ncbi:type II toxin-antitoxin system VapC family toxin [Hymenobacter gummosus]|uniref:Type II toxin-antitoxin system VapC family toxin n=1 Tax=Hymenobacter gummosus TaxID=1776032 RepID=A0A431U5S0_9BACT|nr:type II toxin-antitoxin system VapC family toxin [Hymenobacter gummosus]RTQ51671.1 type II toxin-antitoxin system VapC family toxin [Hymenobacter gummosus]